MKKGALVLIFTMMLVLILNAASFATSIPQPNEYKYYYDEVGVLTDATKGMIVFTNDLLKEACGAEIAVVVVNTTGSEAIDDYAYDLFNSWGIGDSQKNNGFLLLLAIEDDNYYALAGTGLDTELSGGVIDEMFTAYLEPDFAKKDYDDGVAMFFSVLVCKIASIHGVNVTTAHGMAVYSAYKAANGFDLSSLSLDELHLLQSSVATEISSRIAQQAEEDKATIETPTSTNYESATGHTLRELFPCEALAEIVRKEVGLMSLDQPIPEGKLNSFKCLNWSCIESDTVIDSLEGIQYLKGLWILQLDRFSGGDYSSLTHLPEGVYDLEHLYRFDVSATNITDIDWARVVKMPDLTELYITGTSVTSIPIEISEATQLSVLRIINTSLTSIPDYIGDIHTLTVLCIENNPYITEFPMSIVRLTNLEELSFRKTPICELPGELSTLTSLKSLDISYTKISIIPSALYSLNLDTFKTDGITVEFK